jgi:hypothetical protein
MLFGQALADQDGGLAFQNLLMLFRFSSRFVIIIKKL